MNDGTGAPPGLLSAMLDPGFYPQAPPSVELRETHISWVFLAGELAYKVKKPVVLPFLDYGTRALRHEMCSEEIRLNRRLAPSIYLAVVGLAHRDDRWALTREDDPEAVEHAVEMRRVDESRSLASLAVQGELDRGQMSRVAQRLARFHREADEAPSERASVAVLAETLKENLTTLREIGAATVGERRLDAAEHFTWAFVGAISDELEARGRRGLVRDCHGDLRAEHVIVPVDEAVYAYDCVEFNPALRQIDVAADLAFLVMDLARLGAQADAALLTAAYRAAGGDPGDDCLVSFFASYRAWVRAKVACLRALDLPESDPDRLPLQVEARDLLALGHRFAWQARRPLVLVICGVTATGKSTLASALADLSGWAHLSSDITRKRLAGLAATERGGAALYSPDRTRETYLEMGRAAAELYDQTGGVIADATFHRREQRAAFRAGLGDRDPQLLFIECRAAPGLLATRIRERDRRPDRVSDADIGILERQLEQWEPLEELPAGSRAELDTEAPPDSLVQEVERLLDDSLPWTSIPPRPRRTGTTKKDDRDDD